MNFKKQNVNNLVCTYYFASDNQETINHSNEKCFKMSVWEMRIPHK